MIFIGIIRWNIYPAWKFLPRFIATKKLWSEFYTSSNSEQPIDAIGNRSRPTTWFRYWLGTVRHQAITSKPYLLCHHWGTVSFSWARLNIKTFFPRYGDSHVKDKTVMRRLIFNMGIPILVRRHLYIETAPWWQFHRKSSRYQYR